MDRLGVKLHDNSGGEIVQTGLGPEREAEPQEALAGQAAAG